MIFAQFDSQRYHLMVCVALCRAIDMDADGFLGEADLEHWYGVNRALLETGGFDAVSLEQV